MDLKFTQTGKYLIAAGCEPGGASDTVSPLLFISIVGEKGWATRYPMQGSFARAEDAAAAALHYGIQIITRQAKHVARPGESAVAVR
ncbi:MAG TPA: hypothetical protein VFV77_05895 [Gammaproteobacteria bacterium]|nr:hypothetical protein [Gammaproteobacteria bacterium]